MSEKMEIQKDPAIKTNLIAPVVSWLIWTALVVASFTTNSYWGILFVQTGVWALFIMSLLICLGYACGGQEHLTKTPLPLRLPKLWLPVSAVASTCLLWYFSGGLVWLTAMWGFSRIVLSMNYQNIEEMHDTKYTKKLQSDNITRQEALKGVTDAMNDIMDIIKKGDKTDNKRSKRSYWDTKD